jgi:hypothetical protein
MIYKIPENILRLAYIIVDNVYQIAVWNSCKKDMGILKWQTAYKKFKEK